MKRSILVEKEGGPLTAAVAPANRYDTKLLEEPLAAIAIDRSEPTEEASQHLCLDKGYDNPTGHAAVEASGYSKHIRPIGEEPVAPDKQTDPPRHWVVEAYPSWLNRWRGLLVRYEKEGIQLPGSNATGQRACAGVGIHDEFGRQVVVGVQRLHAYQHMGYEGGKHNVHPRDHRPSPHRMARLPKCRLSRPVRMSPVTSECCLFASFNCCSSISLCVRPSAQWS